MESSVLSAERWWLARLPEEVLFSTSQVKWKTYMEEYEASDPESD